MFVDTFRPVSCRALVPFTLVASIFLHGTRTEAQAPSRAPSPKPARLHDHAVAHDDAVFSPGKGLTFASKDGLFSLELRLRAQFLYQVTRPVDPSTGKYEDLRQGAQIRRARLQFAGKMWGKRTTYYVVLAFAPGDIGLTNTNENPPVLDDRDSTVTRSPLRDWYMQFGQLRDLNVRVGQYKVPYSRDRVTSSGNLQFVDRTLLNAEFNLDRDIGIDLRSKDLLGFDKKLRYYLGVYNGKGHSYSGLDDFGLMYLGRAEFLPFGDFEDYSQSDLERLHKPRFSVGVAYARVQNAKGNRGILGSRPADQGTTDYDNVTADAMFKMSGASLAVASFFRDGKRKSGGALDETNLPIAVEAPRNGWGAGVQAGYLLPTTNLEFAVRYSAIRAHGKRTSLKDSNETGLALSYFFAEHAYKLQADYLRYWGEGARQSGGSFAKGQDQFRVQLQAAF